MLEDTISDVVNKIPEDCSPIVPMWVDMNDRVDLQINHTRVVEHAVRSSSYKEVDAMGAGIGVVDFEQSVPGRRRRITQMRQIVRLMACHNTARLHQLHHLFHDSL